MIADLRHALRSLARSPGFTAIAVITLALGIGMNTAMFSMLNALLLRPLSYPQPERLFRLDRATQKQPFGNHAPANFADIARDSASFADLAALRYWGFTLSEPNQPADAPFAARVTANYFDVLGLKLHLGRSFLPEEDTPGTNNVIVISYNYWQSRFGGDPNIIGRSVRIDGTPTEIIGVLSPRDNAMRISGPVAIFRPMAFTESDRANRTEGGLFALGRYRADIEPAQAAAKFEAIARRLATDFPAENGDMILGVRSLQSTTLTGVVRTITFLLVGLSGFVLLIACGNLANLLLARAISRARESSIRAALGASSAQLIRPFAVECIVLATAGGLAAMLVSMWTSDWLSQQFSNPTDPVEFSTDGRVLAFTVAVSFITAVLFGVAPAWWASRTKFNDSLKTGARGTGSRSQNRYRQLLIVTQFALTLVLLAGAGFFIRGVERLARVESGWNPAPLITGSVNLASARYNSTAPIVAFHTQLRESLLANPDVANVSVSYEEPLFNSPSQRGYLVEGREAPKPGQEAIAFTNGISASYFDTFGTRLLRGRVFNGTDTHTSQPVVIINDTMARSLFPNQDPIGQRLGVVGAQPPAWAEIVGIVEDVRAQEVNPSPIVFQVYKPYPQESWQYVSIAVRATEPARAPALLEAIRRTVAELDPDQPVLNLMLSTARLERNTAFLRTINQLLILFAGLGLLLAALGIYGVTARLVTQRTTEIGIRMALGAQVRDIARLVLGGGLRLTLAGAAVGLAGALVLSRYLSAEMPAFGGASLLPISVACAVLVCISLLACFLPARRATRVNPAIALRAE
jgi:putative ABC transport system permease protein